ncbi:transcriptional regulator GcvA [Rhizobium sp. S-51]|uniref:HTH-type transcriptional regulator TtuA n=1 Tax=Rhizobium terricola TaxID=2728849 RepID=A0A7Y0AZN9_9HYPH|nr:transcriptional regulator GcvA [Rhizobium terricola]NML76466.1 transcriptional regulator GcvA [Rhizobium terricola]
MSSRLPPLNPLRAFEAAARRGSISAAARELNVTHGAVSHQIKTLEETLKAALFERGGKRLKLTPQGALLLPAVSSAFDGIAAATALMNRPSTSGTLRVACVPALLSLWLIPRMNAFSEQYPEISLKLSSSNDSNLIHSPDVDVAILYGPGGWRDCWTRLWSTFELFPVVSPSLLNSRPLRSVRDLRDHVLLHGDDGREWNTWLAAADQLDAPRGRQHFMSDARLSTEAARHGQGIALGDSITASSLIAAGELIIPFDLSVPASDAFYVAARNEMRAAPIVRVFIDWMFATLENERSSQIRPAVRQTTRSRTPRAGKTAPITAEPASDPALSA